MRGLGVSVFRTADLGDCTNGGVTARLTRLVLFADGMEGYIDPKGATPGEALLLKRDKTYLGGYLYAVPAIVTEDGRVVEALPPDGHIGWMAGGNYVGTSDSRFSRAVSALGVVPVHDRSESYKLYQQMSD